ncbi:efflux RND transporter periplasmic adaptor subunit [Devosia rhodophyticola]|uniref:Efflux RND transporter periplasmic adaptor subunit n=1 Tax=Devosia rhodophyticola TaxID=3026423 RepID=A0ABY7YXK1_9HYPH|nr:efflux RND transporter periplasmic adaptor subunit [Devosia rhodophyticola]WDR05520.1 efflux RND transporter periplasmic adaptor subunit [Devosia rhodophyticola]
MDTIRQDNAPVAPTSDKPNWAQSKFERANSARIAAGEKPKRRKGPWIVLAVLIVGGVAAYVIVPRLNPAPVTPAAEAESAELIMQLVPEEIETVAPRLLEDTVKVTGTLGPVRQVQLNAQINGPVLDVAVDTGDRVSAKQVVVNIDTESLRIQFDQQSSSAEATRVQLSLAERQLDRTLTLSDRGLSSAAAVEQAQSSVDGLRANLNALQGQVSAAQISLNNAIVVAPFDGVVASRSAQPGQTVSIGAPLLTVVDLSKVELQANAPVSTSGRIRSGQRVDVTFDGLSNQTFVGKVERLAPLALQGTRVIPVFVSLDNSDLLLRGGMFGTGRVVVDQKQDSLAVPVAAVREDINGSYILKLENGVVVRQTVETGGQWNDGRLVEIVTGIVAGDTIVTAPLTQLNPGDQYAIVED